LEWWLKKSLGNTGAGQATVTGGIMDMEAMDILDSKLAKKFVIKLLHQISAMDMVFMESGALIKKRWNIHGNKTKFYPLS
jgi:hypothetical protein